MRSPRSVAAATSLAMTTLLCLAVPALGFQSVEKSVRTGGVQFTQSPTFARFTVEVRNRTNNALVGDGTVRWSSITADNRGWRMADQYFKIDLNFNASAFALQLYTDNTSAFANPRFDPRGKPITATNDPAGLLATDNPIDAPNARIQLAWKILNDKKELPSSPDYPQFDFRTEPGTGKDLGFGATDFTWLFAIDKSTGAFGSGEVNPLVASPSTSGNPYTQIWNELGIHFAEGPDQLGGADSPNFLYLAGDFTNAARRQYKTNRIIFEVFTP